MQCPACHRTESRVLESRSVEHDGSVRRRRECLHCRQRFTTYERLETFPLAVIKRNGSRESFSRTKLLRGLSRACEKTAITPDRVKLVADELQSDLQQDNCREISSKELGELVLEKLSRISDVAYIRFASVYRQFKSIDDFLLSLKLLEKRRSRPDNGPPAASEAAEPVSAVCQEAR